MSTWYFKNLGDGIVAFAPLEYIKERFLALYPETDRSGEIAVFVRHESAGHLHCEVEVYFSPAAHAIAMQLDAEPCPWPAPDGLSLLVGSEESWSALFPPPAG